MAVDGAQPVTASSGAVTGSMSLAFQAFRAAGAPPWVGDLLEYGAGWDLPLPRRPYAKFRQRKLPTEETKFVDSEVRRLLAAGAIEIGTAKIKCPVFCVPKRGPDKYRLIHDLREANKYFQPRPFTLEGLRALPRVLQPGYRAITVDLKSAFHQVLVAPRLRPYLAFEWRGATYLWKVLPFGFTHSPACMQGVAQVLADALTRQGLPASIYLDDCIVGVPPGYPDPMATVRRTFESFGAILAQDKGVDTPSTSVPFLGFLVVNEDAHGYISVPTRKAANLRRTLRLILRRREVPRWQLASVVGSIAALRSACPSASGFIRAAYQAIGAARTRRTRVPLDRRTRGELRWWISALESPMCAFFRHPAPSVTATTDASRLGWGVTLNPGAEISPGTMTTAQGRWRRSQAERLSMGALELLAVKYAVRRVPPGTLTRPTVLRLWCDSSNALAALTRGSAARTCYAIARSTLRLLHRRHVVLVASWISTHDNIWADRLSRFQQLPTRC